MNESIKAEFEQFLASPLNESIINARENGSRIIGYTCSYVPEPLIAVEGLIPVRMRAPGVSGTPMADTYLSSVVCTYTRSILENALDGMYDSLDGWVHTGSCDHLRRLFDNLDYLLKLPFNQILDLPHKTGPAALDWYTRELEKLAASLEEKFDVNVGNDALRKSVNTFNEYSKLLRDISELRKDDAPIISGTEFHTLLVAATCMPKPLLIEKLKSINERLRTRSPYKDYRARLLIVGSQLDDPEYIGIIESLGGLVVADKMCFASIPGLEKIELTDEPIQSLAKHYLGKVSCPRMMEQFRPRVADILETAREYRADGIIVQAMKFCDCWGVEISPLIDEIRGAGFPVLRLERDYTLTGEGQLRTRVQAFIESMGK